VRFVSDLRTLSGTLVGAGVGAIEYTIGLHSPLFRQGFTRQRSTGVVDVAVFDVAVVVVVDFTGVHSVSLLKKYSGPAKLASVLLALYPVSSIDPKLEPTTTGSYEDWQRSIATNGVELGSKMLILMIDFVGTQEKKTPSPIVTLGTTFASLNAPLTF
jgi:hypothetical protein